MPDDGSKQPKHIAYCVCYINTIVVSTESTLCFTINRLWSSCAHCLENWELQPSGTLRTCPNPKEIGLPIDQPTLHKFRSPVEVLKYENETLRF